MKDMFLDLEPDDFDLLQEVPACGCGRPETVYEAYRSVLRWAADFGDDPTESPGQRARREGMDPVLFEVVSGVLDHIEATEHGGSIYGAWATDKGRRLLAILDRYAEDYDRTPGAR